MTMSADNEPFKQKVREGQRAYARHPKNKVKT
jgi:hypothetical protein